MNFSDEDDIDRILASGVDYTEMEEGSVKTEFNLEGISRLRQSC